MPTVCLATTNTSDTMLATRTLMTELGRPLMLDLHPTTQTAFVAGARDLEPVRGLTHGFYKYPARFSPSFVRAAIETFTRPTDFILDNHVGGGTTLVEALALGRRAIGVDISTLASFVATVKTTVLLRRVSFWAPLPWSGPGLSGLGPDG